MYLSEAEEDDVMQVHRRDVDVPQVPETDPPEFGALVARCLSRDPDARPSFDEVVAELAAMGAQPSSV